MEFKNHNRLIRHFITTIFFVLLIIPIILLDLFAELYHQIGFRLCEIPLIKRSNYVKIDRHKLKYLNLFEKVECAYCGYANGLMAYFQEIGARTEKYWCAIKHQKTKNFVEQPHQKDFLKYGDEKTFRKKYKN